MATSWRRSSPGSADIVIGDRQTHTIEHFSAFKKVMQRFGSWVVNRAAGTELPDAASGFRAYSRYALYRINVVTQFSYTMETIIQAGNKSLAIASVEIDTNAKTRESRLFNNMFEHMARSGQAILRSYVMFKPWSVFAALGGSAWAASGSSRSCATRSCSPTATRATTTSRSCSAPCCSSARALSIALGVLSDLAKTNRILNEDQLFRIKEQMYGPALPAATAARVRRAQDQ